MSSLRRQRCWMARTARTIPAVIIVFLLTCGLLINPKASDPAYACSVIPPDYKMNFHGVALSRTVIGGQDAETLSTVWKFRITQWQGGTPGVKARKGGGVVLIEVAERNSSVKETSSCGDIGVTTKFNKGAEYEVTALKYKPSKSIPDPKWHIISYYGELRLL
jgi:hypothetical protein